MQSKNLVLKSNNKFNFGIKDEIVFVLQYY